MIHFRSEKLRQEFNKSCVALRLVVERAVLEFQGITVIFRVRAPATHEGGAHGNGTACDIILEGARLETYEKVCLEVNRRFPTDPLQREVCTLVADPTNMPSGKRIDVPHIHVQIPFDWLNNPRSFLKRYGYTSE